MAQFVTIETEKKQKPTLLFVDTNSGISNTLLDFLVHDLRDKTQVYVLSQKRVAEGVEKISPLSVHFLDKVADNLSYAVIFLDEEQQKKKVLQIISQLENSKTKILVLMPYRVSARFIDVLIHCKDMKHVTVGLLGDVFGKSAPSSPLSKIIQNAFTNKEIVISGNDLLSIFPISDVDVARATQHILFGLQNVSHFHYLFYESPQTLISLVHVLTRIEPELSISYGKEPLGFEGESMGQKERYIKDRTAVTPTRPSSSFIGFEKSVLSMQGEVTTTKNTNKKVKRKVLFKKKRFFVSKVFQITRYLVFGFILYAIIMGALFLTSILFYKNGVDNLLKGNLVKAEEQVRLSEKLYSVSHGIVSLSSGVLVIFPNEKVSQSLSFYDDLMPITGDLLVSLDGLKSTDKQVNQDSLKKLISASVELYFLTQRYNLQSLGFKDTGGKLIQASHVLPLFPVALSALGYDSPKTYLLLFQNNNELRPTGGFIGSVGVVTLKNGAIDNLSIQDVYDLDGQLKGHVDPPYIVRRFLQPHLYLRDSNFAPNFEESATTSAFLYNLEADKKVDGVIALDTEVLKTAVQVAGPITLPGSSKSVSSQNVVDLVQNTIQDNNFAGSTEKKQILQTILNKMVVNLEESKGKQINFLKAAIPLVLQKHILFTFANNPTQRAFTSAGFTGSLSDFRIGANILKDFLSISEANIGVNKANAFVTRKVTYSAFLKPGVLNSDALVEYTNTGESDYKVYIRFIVPEKTRLLNVQIDGVEQKVIAAITDPLKYERKNFTPPVGLEVDEETKEGKNLYGFVTTIAKNSTVRIRTLYENTDIVPTASSFKSSLLYIKQPGTNRYPLTVQLQTTSRYKQETESGSQSPILYDDEVSTDKEITAHIQEAE